MNNISVEELDRVIYILDTIRANAIKDSTFGFSDDWVIFMKKMRILTPQSSGSRIQNYIFRALGWKAIPASLNKGDVKNSLGQYFEVKISQITASNSSANIVQIRLWQSISGHHIFVIDSTKNYTVTHFALSKHEMEQEVKLCGNNAHGTKIANTSNQNIEWAIRIDWKDSAPIFQRWVTKYKQDTDITKGV